MKVRETTPKSLKNGCIQGREYSLERVKISLQQRPNFTLAVAKTKFAAVRILRIKGPAEQPEPTRCSENTSRCNENTLS